MSTAADAISQQALDRANAEFWDELCGTSLARDLGIIDRSAQSLQRFDRAYLDYYPYLLRHVPADSMAGKKVLEVGLGYGTLGQQIAQAGADYAGLDISSGPVAMMNHRLRMAGLPGRAIQGSMLDCPLDDASVDCVVSIGCFHHTGDVARCISETWRVLRPGGRAYLMLYNRFSYRQWVRWPRQTLAALLAGSAASEDQRKAYDSNLSGAAAPETVFLSVGELRGLLSRFARTKFSKENSDPLVVRGRTLLPRPVLLKTFAKLAGLDIYIQAEK